MKGNGAEGTQKLSIQAKLTESEIADVTALCTVLGMNMTEFATNALRAELKAVESQPTVQAALDAMRGAREHVARRKAALAQKGAK